MPNVTFGLKCLGGNADKIVVIHNGKINEQGTHAGLPANQGMY